MDPIPDWPLPPFKYMFPTPDWTMLLAKLYPASSVTDHLFASVILEPVPKRDVTTGFQSQQSAASAQIPGIAPQRV